jgi:phosphopantetheine adenylyltransferase
MFTDIDKVPCSAHRLNLCANDLFSIKNITVKVERNVSIYFIFDYNENDELRKMEIDEAKKHDVETINEIKQKYIKISDCKHLVGSFRHSDGLVRKLKQKQIDLRLPTGTKLVQCVSTRWNST